jgi:hypothetical protein
VQGIEDFGVAWALVATVREPYGIAGLLEDRVLEVALVLGVLKSINTARQYVGACSLKANQAPSLRFSACVRLSDIFLVVTALEPIHDLCEGPDLALELAATLRATIRDPRAVSA